jgi:hypothetical protein
VAIGFTRGERQGDQWSVGTRDAHAWVEIYFTGLGWVPFDPTPLGGEGNAVTLPYTVPAAPAPDGDPAAGGPGRAAPTPTNTAPLNPKADQLDRQQAGESPAGTPPVLAAAPAWSAPLWPAVAGGVLLAVLLVVPAVARVVRRRRRFAVLAAGGGSATAAAHAAWDELLDTLTDLRTPARDADTPRLAAARVGALGDFDEEGRAALHRLATAEERARYAAAAVPPDGLAEAVEAVRTRLLAGAGRRAALRAALAPVSVLEAATAWAGSAGGRVTAGLRRLRPTTPN